MVGKATCLTVLPRLSEWNKWDLGVRDEPVVTLRYQPSNDIQKRRKKGERKKKKDEIKIFKKHACVQNFRQKAPKLLNVF